MTRYPGLDLLRALAISWVLLFHGMTEGLGRAFPPVARLGWMGVDLFFVLSGFLIGSQLFKPYTAGRRPEMGYFYLRRAFRIVPAFWLIAFIYFQFPVLREASGIQPLWQFLSFTENLLIDYQHNATFSHAWSLCVEEHFYLILPLLVWGLMRRPSWKTATLFCVLLIVFGILLRAYVWTCYVDIPEARPQAYIELLYYPTYMRLDGLLAGVVLAALKWFRPGIWQKIMNHPYWVLTVGIVALVFAVHVAQDRIDFNASVFGFPALSWAFAVIVAACVSPKGILGLRRVPGAQSIATITFSLYLSHKLTWHAVRTFLPDWVEGCGPQAFVVYAGSAIIMGTLLFLFVERPFLRLRDRVEAHLRKPAENSLN